MKRSAVATLLGAIFAQSASAQLAISANDGKVRLDNGVVKTVPNNPDTLAIINLGTRPPRLLYEIEAPASIVGPPTSVAVAPDESFALVTANMKLDPADPSKQVADNRMSVIDLKAIVRFASGRNSIAPAKTAVAIGAGIAAATAAAAARAANAATSRAWPAPLRRRGS